MFGLQLQHWIVSSLYVAGNGFLQILQGLLYGPDCPEYPSNVLIFRTGNLGDTICAIPAMRAVKARFPKAKLILLTAINAPGLPQPPDILEGMGLFDEIELYHPHEFRGLRPVLELRNRIKLKSIDLIVYLGQDHASVLQLTRDLLFFRMAGCRKAVGYQFSKHRVFRIAQRHLQRFNHEVDRLLNILEPLGINRFKAVFDLPIGEDDRNWVDQLRPWSGWPNHSPIVALAPGAKIPVKRWPLERFSEVAAYLQRRYGAFVVLIGGDDELSICQQVCDSISEDSLNLAGKTTYMQAAEVLRRCDLLISNDSGPVHLAAAVGTPVVGIYSSMDFPYIWSPYGQENIVLRHDVDCQICLRTECPEMICIDGITVGEVAMASVRILDQHLSLVKDLRNDQQT